MANSLSISSFKPSRAFVSCLVFLVLWEILLSVLGPPLWQDLFENSTIGISDALKFDAQLHHFTKHSPSVLLMGSSQMRGGIDAKQMAEELGRQTGKQTAVLNLGVASGEVVDMYLQLPKILSAKPDMIVLMPYWWSFYQPYHFVKLKYYLSSFHSFVFLIRLYGLREFLKQAGHDLIDVFLVNVLPSYLYIRSELVIPVIEKVVVPEDPLKQNQPWNSLTRSQLQQRILELQPELKAEITDETIRMKKIFYAYAAALSEKGIRLVVLEAPLHPVLIDYLAKEYPEAWQDYHHFLKQASRELGFSYFDKTQHPAFPDREFMDLSHLNLIGRKRMTHFIAQHLTPLQNVA